MPYPVVVLASYFQFAVSYHIRYEQVFSRMLLWVVEGQGQVVANRSRYSMVPGDFLLLPWRHAIAYYPDARRPFLVGGIHLIPDHVPNVPVTFAVGVQPGMSPNVDMTHRRDVMVPGCEKVLKGTLSRARSLAALAVYVVEWYQHAQRLETEAHYLGALLLQEFSKAVVLSARQDEQPELLQRLLSLAATYMEQPLSLADLAQRAGCSPSTVTRLFRRHLGISPTQWIIRTKMEYAAQLLTTTRLAVGEVARQVGVDEPLYFSKLFKKVRGVSPSVYRHVTSLLPK